MKSLWPKNEGIVVVPQIDQPQETTIAALGPPLDSKPMDEPKYTKCRYAYRDGWLYLTFRDQRVWLILETGPYADPVAYPPVQSDIAVKTGKPVKNAED
jgi:hypothetical protein